MQHTCHGHDACERTGHTSAQQYTHTHTHPGTGKQFICQIKSHNSQSHKKTRKEQNKLYKSRVTYNKWKQVQQSQNPYSHLSQPKIYHNKGEGFKTSSRMPSRGTVVIPRGYPQRQPNLAKGSRDIINKSNKRGYRSQEALTKRRTDRNNENKERSYQTDQKMSP